MQLLSVFLFSLSANIDSFTVGLAYGMKNIKINYRSNILIAIITSLGTFISMGLGLFTKKLIPVKIITVMGCVLLIALGLTMIINAFKEKKLLSDGEECTYRDILTKPQRADADKSGYIETKESVTLALALSLNNFGLGVGASVTGIDIYLTTSFTFILSILCIIIGIEIGKRYISETFKQYADLISGLVILMLGLYELFLG